MRPTKNLSSAELSVRSIIEILIDSQEGLVTIGEKLEDTNLKRYFFAESLKRAQFIRELELLLEQHGQAKIREKGSAAGTVHRTWARIKSRFIHGDHTLLVTGEQGERATSKLYNKLMRSDLPFSMRKLLVRQSKHIHSAYSHVKGARDRTSAGLPRPRMVPARKAASD